MKNSDTTTAELSARIWGLSARLATAPLPVPRPTVGAGVPTILHRGHLLGAIFSALYRPANWGTLASAIAQAEDGDGAALAELSGAGGADWAEHVRNVTDTQRAEEAGWGTGREMGASEGGMAVSCGDAPPFEVGAGGADGGAEVWTKAWMGWRDQVRIHLTDRTSGEC